MIDPLLQLGLYDYVWGNPTLLQTYNSNVQAEQNRESQREYNKYLKEYDRAKLEEEKAKRESIAQATAEAKITELLDGYGYKTPQQRDLIDRQINVAVADGGLNPESVNALKELAVKNAEDEMLERSAKNAVLDPIRSKIRLHGAYSAEPNWKGIPKDEAKAYQKLLGFKGKAVDGVLGTQSQAKIAEWNTAHPDNMIPVPPNELEDILDEIDQLRYVHNDEEKQFSPAELDELRKLVYGGEDPTAANRKNWDDWARGQAQSEAEDERKQKKLTKSAQTAIASNTPPSSLSEDVITKIGELGYTWDSANRKWKRKGAK